MMKIKIGIIGNGKMAADCIKHLLTFENVEVRFAIYQSSKDPQLAVKNFCESNGIETKVFKKLNDTDALDYIKSKETDYIFSINNFRIIGIELINIPSVGIINFHNGPLPAYGGVNIPSWAIINGEKQHGVTWHFVNEGIDTGDMIAQSLFEIDDDTTAARLMTTSIIKGLKLFKEFTPELFNGNIKKIPQEGKSSYFSLKDFPENNGVIKFSWDFTKISRLVRGLNFFPYSNDFVYACIENNGVSVVLNDVSLLQVKPSDIPAGKILRLNDSDFHVACDDSVVSLDSIMTIEMEEMTPEEAARVLEIKEGDILK